MQTLQKPTKNTPSNLAAKQPNPLRNYKHDSTWAIAELRSLLEAAQNDKQIISKIQLFAPKPYSNHQFKNWRTRYDTVPKIQELSKKIEEVIESNLIYKGMSANPAFPIFLLKNHYNYQDKREVATDHNYTFTVSRGLPAPVRKQVVAKATQVKK